HPRRGDAQALPGDRDGGDVGVRRVAVRQPAQVASGAAAAVAVASFRRRMSDGAELAARLRDGDLAAAPAVLNLVENRAEPARAEIAALLHGVAPRQLGGEARGHVVGVTGPPGAGKSTLL